MANWWEADAVVEPPPGPVAQQPPQAGAKPKWWEGDPAAPSAPAPVPAAPSVAAPATLPPFLQPLAKAVPGVEARLGKPPTDWLGQAGAAMTDVLGSAARGVSKAGQSVYDLTAGAMNLVSEPLGGPKFGGLDLTLPGQPKGTVAQFTEPVTQFLAGFAAGGPVLKGVGLASKMGPTGQAFAKGALADFLAFKGTDPRLSNVVQAVPGLRNSLTAYLAADPADPEIVGRLKNTLEGMGMGGLTEGIIRGVRAFRTRPKEMSPVEGEAPIEGAGRAPQGQAGAASPLGLTYADLKPLESGKAAEVLAFRPPQNADVIGAGGAARTEADLAAEAKARDLGAVGSDAATDRLLDMARGKVASPKPESLMQFVRRMGGLKEQGGELRAIGIDARSQPGFVKQNGRNLDDMAELAWEAGYFGVNVERPTIAQFLDGLDRDFRGQKLYRPDEMDLVQQADDLLRLQEQLDQAGIDLTKADNATVRAILSGETAAVPRTAADLLREEKGLAASGAVVPDAQGLRGPAEKAGNINLAFIETTDDVKRLLRGVAKTFEPTLEAARRGVITQAETRNLAQQLGMTTEDLLRRRKGQAFNAEEALAARSLLTKAGEDLQGLAQKARGGSEADLLAFEQGLARHVAIQEQVAGLTAEAGRALAAFKITANSQGVRDKLLRQIITEAGGRDKIEEMAERIASIDDPDAIAPFVRDAWKPRFRDKLFELWINSLLSGPRTHVVNITSNFLTSLWDLPEQGLAALFGAGRGGADRVTGREIVARIHGMAEGAVEGLNYAAKALKSGESGFDPLLRKVETRRDAIGGLGGQLARIPTRLLGAEDDLFKAFNYRAELRAQAMREGLGKGLKGDALKEHVRAVLASPDEALRLKAMDKARYMTFTSELGRLGSMVRGVINRIPGGRVVIPFIRTPANLIKYAMERTPLGFAMGKVRVAIAKGGAAKDLALARIGLGSGVMVAIASLADAGKITGGGPADPGQRRVWLQTHQPYSVKIGDRWVSYQRLDPLATLIGSAADFAELSEQIGDPEADKIGALLVGSVTNNLLDKTWLRGPAELVQAITDPERYGQSWMQSLVGTLVPTGVAQFTQSEDPFLRSRASDKTAGDPLAAEAQGMLNAIRARLPGQSEDLPLVRDLWGQPIKRETLGPSWLSPFATKSAAPDLPSQELERLGYAPSRLTRELQGVPLSPKEYDKLTELAGTMARQIVERFVNAPRWKVLPDEAKRALLEKAFSESNQTARALLLREFPDLVKRIGEAKRKEAEALSGVTP